jgi:hypothetical protein
VAYGANLLEAYDRAYQTDPESAFGGIIAFNGRLDGETAKAIVERQFVEVIIAPEVSPEASEAVAAKKNVRLLECGNVVRRGIAQMDMKRVAGGLLVQDADILLHGDLKVVTSRAPSEKEMEDLLFAWRVAKFVKSNAIVYAKDRMTIGVGAGQMSPRQLRPHRRHQGRAGRPGGARLGDGFRRLLPVPGRSRQRRRRRHHGGDPAGRLHARRRGHRGGQRAWHRHGVHRRAALQALI